MPTRTLQTRRLLAKRTLPADYATVLAEMKQLVSDARRRSLAAVNSDLLLFHRRLQCLVAVELKSGEFKPEHIGKCQFYLAALDEYARLPHEKPSVGLILCKSAKGIHVRLALTLAARRVGVATYQTALPDEESIRKRLEGTRAPEGTSFYRTA